MKIIFTSHEYSLIRSVVMDIKGSIGDKDPMDSYNKDIVEASWINDNEFQFEFKELFITKAIRALGKYTLSVVCALKTLIPAAESLTQELELAAQECAEKKRREAEKEKLNHEYAEITLKIAEAQKKLENLRI